MTIRLICTSLLFASCIHPSFGQTPKGRLIFSSRANDTSRTELYTINSDGTGERMITHLNNKDKDLPSVFHNRMVYRQVEDKKSQRASLLITGTNGGQPKHLIENQIVCNPRWSHDGKFIAYENYPGNNANEIRIIDSNGKNDHLLMPNARHPCWSFDNQAMLFTKDYNVWLLDRKNGTEKKLTSHCKDTVARFPALSPDGKWYAYHAQFGNKFGIFIADLKTSKIQKFIPRCSETCSWTNNPKYIVCSCMKPETKNWEIAIVNIETGEKTYVTKKGNSNYTPAWVSE